MAFGWIVCLFAFQLHMGLICTVTSDTMTLMTSPVTWHDAVAGCAAKGQRLLRLSDHSVNALTEFAQKNQSLSLTSFWVGAFRSGSLPFYRNLDCTRVSNESFPPTETYSTYGDCSVLNLKTIFTRFAFYSVPCDSYVPFLCEDISGTELYFPFERFNGKCASSPSLNVTSFPELSYADCRARCEEKSDSVPPCQAFATLDFAILAYFGQYFTCDVYRGFEPGACRPSMTTDVMMYDVYVRSNYSFSISDETFPLANATSSPIALCSDNVTSTDISTPLPPPPPETSTTTHLSTPPSPVTTQDGVGGTERLTTHNSTPPAVTNATSKISTPQTPPPVTNSTASEASTTPTTATATTPAVTYTASSISTPPPSPETNTTASEASTTPTTATAPAVTYSASRISTPSPPPQPTPTPTPATDTTGSEVSTASLTGTATPLTAGSVGVGADVPVGKERAVRVSPSGAVCGCKCAFNIRPNNTDAARALARKILALRADLRLDVTSLSRWRRRRESAGDARQTARGVGGTGVLFLSLVFSAIVISDAHHFQTFFSRRGSAAVGPSC